MKLRLFISHLLAAFSGVPPWDQGLIDAGLLPAELWIE